MLNSLLPGCRITPILHHIFTSVILLTVFNANADPTWEYSVQASAQVQSSPPRITLTWPQDTFAIPDRYTVYRKAPESTSWGTGVVLPGTTTSYADDTVTPGVAYEYQIAKTNTFFSYSGFGYVYSGIEVPLVEDRGKVVLIVDNTFTAGLAGELSLLVQDLVGDGWTVLRHDVARGESPVNVKSLIQAEYNADPARVKAVFLFGHIPVVRSGNLNVDGHGGRPMPADVFYGDMDGLWTDANGDGIYDQSRLPSDVKLEVGRVDFAQMPGRLVWNGPATFPSEVELLRRYLNKDHDFRHAHLLIQHRALVGDALGMLDNEAPAASGYRNFAPLLGSATVDLADTEIGMPSGDSWSSLLSASPYLWAYGCGAGSYSGMSGLGLHGIYDECWSTDIVGQDAKAVFSLLFGSWLGDWDSEDNIMRAMLAAPSAGLTCSWSGRPHHYYHHMGLGETVGYGIRLSQNNNGLYQNLLNKQRRGIHIALMGDPTLRMYPIAPVTGLYGGASEQGTLLQWTPSSDAVLGYFVYRANDATGEYDRITPDLVGGTSFNDITAGSGNCNYMVRAVKLETTPSGSFYNASQGAFTSVDGVTLGLPTVTVTETGGNAGTGASAPPAGRFYIHRYGSQASDLTVYFTVRHDWSDGTNSQADESTVIPAGWDGAEILVATDDTSDTSADAITLTLSLNLDYVVGSPDSATVSIAARPTVVWVDDALPAGATVQVNGNPWQWDNASPAPFSGAGALHSDSAPEMHQLFFEQATDTLSVGSGDTLFAYVYLDPANPPDEVMLQWNDGSWDHRAYWGANNLGWGIDGTPSRFPAGPLPATGQWVRLEVPASAVGLEGRVLTGMAFTLHGGRATWDYAGKSSP